MVLIFVEVPSAVNRVDLRCSRQISSNEFILDDEDVDRIVKGITTAPSSCIHIWIQNEMTKYDLLRRKNIGTLKSLFDKDKEAAKEVLKNITSSMYKKSIQTTLKSKSNNMKYDNCLMHVFTDVPVSEEGEKIYVKLIAPGDVIDKITIPNENKKDEKDPDTIELTFNTPTNRWEVVSFHQ